jgi:hypothetical protein
MPGQLGEIKEDMRAQLFISSSLEVIGYNGSPWHSIFLHAAVGSERAG